ncbi:MAG TPA: RNA polymerase sigma factor [bacterium]|nr:RNA polymerase sigma factor [bacterium]
MNRNLERDLLRGKPEAFERLFDLYADSLYRLAYAFLFNRPDAEDAVQESLLGFVDALRSGKYRSGNGTLETYLKQCVRNRCINLLTRRGAAAFPLEEEEDSPLEPDIPLHPSALSELQDRQALEQVETAIGKLPPAQRSAVVLRIVENQAYRDIAQELGISIDAVKNLLGRARKTLRRELRILVDKDNQP